MGKYISKDALVEEINRVLTELDKFMFVWYVIIAIITGISIGLLIGQFYFK